MSSWRDEILRHFHRDGVRLTAIHDPDRLLTEEGILKAIQRNGYEVVVYDDPIAFRYAYEAHFRSAWDAGEDSRVVVVVQGDQDIDLLPYDILSGASRLEFALYDIFPALSYPVITELDSSLFDRLWEAYRQYDGEELGDQKTEEYVLTHCLEILPELVNSPVKLMELLLRRHYRGQRYPEMLDRLLITRLEQQPALADYPLRDIVPNRHAFFSFLQRQWHSFIQEMDGADANCIVPFAQSELHLYLDNLFLDGLLSPIAMPGQADAVPDWARWGILTDDEQDTERRFDGLLARAESRLPTEEGSYRDWLSFADLWAEAVVMRWRLGGKATAEQSRRWKRLHEKLEAQFAGWMLGRMGTITSLPAHPRPVMAHMIPRYLASLRNRGEADRIALIVVDGMAMDQWVVLRQHLAHEHPGWRYDVTPVFTWVPTITSVCRQAIFAGQRPLEFPATIRRTDRDAALWARFWQEQGVGQQQVRYWRGNATEALDWLDETMSDSGAQAIGMVLSDVDSMAHGATLGTDGLHHSMMLWACRGQLGNAIARLQAGGFEVFITSDHGNVEAVGMGAPREGVLVDATGARARLYSSKRQRADAHAEFPNTVEWTGAGLPPGNEVLLSEGLSAFTTAGKTVVTHGGISLEETIVPFIRVITGASDDDQARIRP